MKNRFPVVLPVLFLFFAAASNALAAGELARLVRLKISAGDILSGAAAIEDYKRKNGVDAEYLDALGWLARGAEMFGKLDMATQLVAELRREIKEEKSDLITPLGAAIETEGKLRARKDQRNAIAFLEQEYSKARDVALRARIRKSINELTLEGQPAPSFNGLVKGKPVLLFLWAHWCGDCRAQAETLARVYQKYKAQDLVVIAPTRLYGTGDQNKTATAEEEKTHIAKVWADVYRGLEGVAIPIDTDTMIQYGVSATPTFVFIDKKGIVRFYTPTRLSEAELSNRIESILK